MPINKHSTSDITVRVPDEILTALDAAAVEGGPEMAVRVMPKVMRRIVDELRTRRSHDLTTADREALEIARATVSGAIVQTRQTFGPGAIINPLSERAIAVLTRLLGEP